MKKLLTFIMTVLFVFSFSYANAELLGTWYETFPDIHLNTLGTITFTYNTDATGTPIDGGVLHYTADDEYITMINPSTGLPQKQYWNGAAAFDLTMTLDASGVIQSGEMTEIVKDNNTIEIDTDYDGNVDYTYTEGTELLRGHVIAYGTDGDDFDFLVFSTTGALVDDNLWLAKGEPGETYIHGDAVPDFPNDTWWETDGSAGFTLLEAKADKNPTVPEPGTLLLLGIGLAGICGLGLRKKQD